MTRKDDGPGVPEGIPRTLQGLVDRLGADSLDRLWIFAPRIRGRRESGLVVYGFGERKTPQPFVAACDKFIYTDILKPPTTQGAANKPKFPSPKKKLLEAVDKAAGDDGWANLGRVGEMLLKNDPSFDARSYGFKKLVEMASKQPYLEVRKTKIASGGSTISVRLK